MRLITDRFTSWTGRLPSDFLLALDRAFERALSTEKVYPVTTSYTFTEQDDIFSVQVDASAAAVTVYLPATPTGHRRRTVTKIDASANAVTVDGNGSNINGAATYALAAQYNTVTVEPTGTEWIVV